MGVSEEIVDEGVSEEIVEEIKQAPVLDPETQPIIPVSRRASPATMADEKKEEEVEEDKGGERQQQGVRAARALSVCSFTSADSSH
mmetsp:Transcript_29189/g.45918  ORF Transcript_29189/g.45918 Transcript_29189/m.45918 type:complete len:86 (+) Transcript_29189:341-598(+)